MLFKDNCQCSLRIHIFFEAFVEEASAPWREGNCIHSTNGFMCFLEMSYEVPNVIQYKKKSSTSSKEGKKNYGQIVSWLVRAKNHCSIKWSFLIP